MSWARPWVKAARLRKRPRAPVLRPGAEAAKRRYAECNLLAEEPESSAGMVRQALAPADAAARA